jgi:hypothetical protein
MARRKLADRNTRTLMKLANGRSLAVTLPLETLRAWGWNAGTEVVVKEDPKRHTFTICARTDTPA